MAVPMKLKYTSEQFQKLLNQFQSAIDSGKYTEKIPYETWRKLKKLYHPKIEYISPFVKIYEVIPNIDGVDRDVIMFSAKTYDWGFGRFFYDYVVKKENERMAKSNAGSNTIWDNTKMDLNDGNLYIKADNGNWDALGIATSATLSTTDAVWEYGYSDRTTTSDRTTGYPSNMGTISTITTLDDRVSWLENEIQKKVKKDKCVKENDTMMKGINFDFGPVSSNNIRMSMYGLAVKNASGSWVSYDTNSMSIMDVDIFNFDGAKFLWKMPIALDAVQFGDVIIHARKPMFVTQVTPYTLFAVDPVDGEIKEIMPTKSPFGFNFVTKVMNFMDGMFSGAAPSAQNPFGNMWMMMAMDNSGEQSIDPMVLMAMSMSQGGAMNPMMLMAMSDKMDPDTRNAMLMMSMAAGQNQLFGMSAPHTCQCNHYEGKRVSEDEDAEQVNENARIAIRPRPTDTPPTTKPTQPKN